MKPRTKIWGALGTASYIFVTELLVVLVQVVLENNHGVVYATNLIF